MDSRATPLASRGAGAACIALIGALLACGDDARPTNLLWIVSDTLRADSLHCYGGRAHAPNICGLADSGVLFESAYSTASWTLPSAATLFTGNSPRVYAHADASGNVTGDVYHVNDDEVLLAEELGERGYAVHAFVEKPDPGTEPSNLINAGTYVFEPSVLELIPTGERVSIERDTFPRVVAGGRLHGVATSDYWIDAGRPDLYRAANLDLLGDQRRFDRAEAIAADASVAADATVVNSLIGAGAQVEAGAEVRDSVVLDGARIGAASRVESSLIAGVVGDRARVPATIVGRTGTVAADAELSASTEPPV